jgi:hypothetical protein
MGNVIKAEVKQAPEHTKTVLSPEHLASIRKGKASLAASRAQQRTVAGSKKK